jgi:hypothetical protein
VRRSSGARGVARRGGACAAAALLAVLFALPVAAAELVAVRVGRHEGFTRLVLETDAPAGHAIEEAQPGELLVLELAARSGPRSIASRSRHLATVAVEPEGERSRVRVELRRPVEVRSFVLQGPDRVVIDLYDGTPARVGRPEPTPASEVSEVPPAPEPEAALGVEPAPAPDPETALAPPAPAPAAPPSTAEAGEEAEAPGDEPTREEAPALTWDELAVEERTVVPAPEADEEDAEPGAQEAEIRPVDPVERPQREDAPPAAERRPPVRDLPRVPPLVGDETAPGLPSGSIVLLVLAALAALLLALALALRRRAREHQELLAASYGALDSELEVGPEPAAQAAAAERAAGAGPEGVGPPSSSGPSRVPQPSAGASLFERFEQEPSASTVPSGPGKGASMDTRAPTDSHAEPLPRVFPHEAAAEGDAERRLHELERRIGHLETRLEEFVEAKERLERQVAAQTEELRVQRAAIARTQRVLRSLARPEDEATEPVPKA